MMKKWIASIALAALFSAPALQAEDTVRIATEGAYAPWNFVNDEGKLAGFEVDLGNELCKRMEAQCEFIQNEWDSIIPNLLAGNYDAIMAGMSITDERRETISFSEAYYPPDPSRYAVKKGTEMDWDALEGKSIGVQGATLQAGYAEENLAGKNTIKSYETSDQAVADLMGGSIDALLADGTVSKSAVEGSNGEMEISGPEIMIGEGIAIGLRQDDTGLQEKLNQALEDVKKDGTLDQLIETYFKAGPFYSGS
ncbi:MAG TPA: transporter substrate-binding domain-containing protein [Thiolinea sp.]|nr:transporter substrate-binding domain-containing protein [Thiolinea sp.]